MVERSRWRAGLWPVLRSQSLLSARSYSAVARMAIIPLLAGACKSATTAAALAPLPPGAETSADVGIQDCRSTTGDFVNWSFPDQTDQTGKFVANFDARADAQQHGSIGLTEGAGIGLLTIPAMLYFESGGFFSARKLDEATYETKIIHEPNVQYHVRFEVDVPAQQYSVYITPPGANEAAIAVNYGFRPTYHGSSHTWPMFNNIRFVSVPRGTKMEVCDLNVTEVK